MDEAKLEQSIKDKGLTAPRLTPADIDAVIADTQYHVFEGSQLTVCCITLTNGFTTTGESACVSPENFDAEIGMNIAFGKARDKIWALEGYLLKQKQHHDAMLMSHNENSAQDMEIEVERHKRANQIDKLPITGDWRELLHAVFEGSEKRHTEKHEGEKIGETEEEQPDNVFISLPAHVIEDLRVEMKDGAQTEIYLHTPFGVRKVKVIDDDGVYVEGAKPDE